MYFGNKGINEPTQINYEIELISFEATGGFFALVRKAIHIVDKDLSVRPSF